MINAVQYNKCLAIFTCSKENLNFFILQIELDNVLLFVGAISSSERLGQEDTISCKTANLVFIYNWSNLYETNCSECIACGKRMTTTGTVDYLIDMFAFCNYPPYSIYYTNSYK